MRIPPYYRKPSWQRFFAGMVIGAFLSWCVFLYMHGVMIEDKTAYISKLEGDLKQEKRNVKIWQDDYKKLNEKNLDQLTIQNIEIKILNGEKYGLDSLAVYEAEEEIKEYLNFFLAKDLDFVYKSRDLIQKMIENKVVPLNGKRYRLSITSMFVYTTVSIQIKLHLDE
ncbi:sporulation membrane protein YtrI [Bacillus sp. B15-48]|uniref:sporulation membrane protein YtrI n=1 Tax=Bacillus sp. B15-48 TaxID=1548601 RepID=UPI00193EE4D6|nr:sporulation membrane protein YtrI [Bacillus sp. B15-48]MBM4762544.1 sporulation protein [Bacillus sp. B15-48]